MQAQGEVLKMPFNMIMFAQYLASLDAAQRAGHPQVDQLGAPIELQQQVFPSAPAGIDLLLFHPFRQPCRDRPAHARVVYDQALEHSPCCNGVNSYTSCFNFW